MGSAIPVACSPWPYLRKHGSCALSVCPSLHSIPRITHGNHSLTRHRTAADPVTVAHHTDVIAVWRCRKASPERFEKEPSLAWGFYYTRTELYTTCTPHAGFAALQRIVQDKPGGHFVFTSNVDGIMQRAGFEHSRVLECHGMCSHTIL